MQLPSAPSGIGSRPEPGSLRQQRQPGVVSDAQRGVGEAASTTTVWDFCNPISFMGKDPSLRELISTVQLLDILL